jgi:ribose/xylose/arabinose/galactoside ABC-type transport system permease subunit
MGETWPILVTLAMMLMMMMMIRLVTDARKLK